MSEIIITILSSVATTTVLVAILAWIAKSWIGERIKGSISSEYARQLELLKSEYAHKLETHKASHAHELESRKAELKASFDVALERFRAEITQDRKTQEVAIAAFATAHNAAIERKLRAIETLWDATRKLRSGANRLFFYCDVLTPDEARNGLKDPKIKAIFDGVSHEKVQSSILTDEEPEAIRPFVGEHLWSLFYTYRAVMGRIGYLIAESNKRGKVTYWFDDDGVLRLMSGALTRSETEGIRSAGIGGIAGVQTIIESKMLKHFHELISGKASGDFGWQQAIRIAAIATEVQANMPSAYTPDMQLHGD